MPADPGRTRALARAATGVTAISFVGVLVRAADSSPLTVSFFRMAYALPFLVVMWLITRSRDQRTRRERWIAILSGVILAVDLAFFHAAIDAIGAGLGVLLPSLQVVWVGLFAWFLYSERPSFATLVALPLVLIGVLLTSGLGRTDAYGVNPILGVIFGVTSALLYAGYILTYRAANRSLAPQAGPLLDVTIGAGTGSLVIGLFEPGFDLTPAWPAHGWLLAIALLVQIFGWLNIGAALPRLPALITSIFILLQPALSMVWGAVLFDERLSAIQGLGAVLIFLGVSIVTARGAIAKKVTST